MNLFRLKPLTITAPEDALPGRDAPIPTADTHYVLKRPLSPEVPEGYEAADFGMGCFWGVERMFWGLPGVHLTMVGYGAGTTPNPTYQEVCSGQTGHNELVRVIYDPKVIAYEELLKVFWEGHDPTQGMRQGNDIGTQYRSGIYTYSADQQQQAKQSLEVFQGKLRDKGFPAITTEVVSAPDFYYAEHYHQQYLAKVPNGYCGLGGTGVCYRD